MSIQLKRAYEQPTKSDGFRILVDGLWPRGISKDDLHLDDWLKEIAPGKALRQDFHNNTLSWGQFRRQYLTELKQHRETLRPIARKAERQPLTLVYSASNQAHNNAVVVKQYLAMLSR